MVALSSLMEPGKTLSIRRAVIIEDAMEAYEHDPHLPEYLFTVAYEGEMGIDIGGVRLDCLPPFGTRW